jgi:solute carrier family 25 (adenine nucleotide translocator) protein 4/5/6/31
MSVRYENKKEEVNFKNFVLYFMGGGTSGLVRIVLSSLYRPLHTIHPSRPLILKAYLRETYTSVRRYSTIQAFNFGFKDIFRSSFPKYNPKREFVKFSLTNLICGGLAGAISLVINYPLEYPRVGVFDCLDKVAKNGSHGIRDLYKGFSISLAGVIPFRAVYFGIYDSLVGINPYNSSEKGGTVRVGSNYLIAQVSATAAAYVSFPFDNVRRRLLMQDEKVSHSGRLYNGILDCFKKIIQKEGMTPLFRGSALYSFGSALVLVLYTEIKMLMGFQDGFIKVSDN